MILLVKWIVSLVIGLVIFFIIGWVTGTEEYGGIKTKDDERLQLIKQKSIVSSWLMLLGIFVVNFVFDFFHLSDKRLADVQFQNPELLYLLIAILSYVVFFWIYSRRMSEYEK